MKRARTDVEDTSTALRSNVPLSDAMLDELLPVSPRLVCTTVCVYLKSRTLSLRTVPPCSSSVPDVPVGPLRTAWGIRRCHTAAKHAEVSTMAEDFVSLPTEVRVPERARDHVRFECDL